MKPDYIAWISPANVAPGFLRNLPHLSYVCVVYFPLSEIFTCILIANEVAQS